VCLWRSHGTDWHPPPLATAVGAAVGATVPIGLALAWQASAMLDGIIPVLTVLGGAVGFVYQVIAWWEPARR